MPLARHGILQCVAFKQRNFFTAKQSSGSTRLTGKIYIYYRSKEKSFDDVYTEQTVNALKIC